MKIIAIASFEIPHTFGMTWWLGDAASQKKKSFRGARQRGISREADTVSSVDTGIIQHEDHCYCIV
jgi:hypothetical protein